MLAWSRHRGPLVRGADASGKSAIARGVEAELRGLGQAVTRLELDEIRKSITPAPAYTDRERAIVYRALAYMAALPVAQGSPLSPRPPPR